jgi:phosphotriesterase-related protein
MTRREFLAGSGAAAALKGQSIPRTVLVHEHVLVDFGGTGIAHPSRYNADEVFNVARPHLEAAARLGCRRLQECTPNYLGRDPTLLARLEDATGIEIWSNTGLYAAAKHKFLPDFVKTENPASLAKRWIQEAEQGISGVKPRFIKIGVNNGPLHPIDRKIVEAAALTSRATGLTTAAHTGDGKAALEELEIFVNHKVDPGKFVWVHAQSEKDSSLHEKIARAGAWVEFDGIGEKSADRHLQCVEHMAGKDLLDRVMISQDAGWYHVGEPKGGAYRGYTYIYTDFLPRLRPEWQETLMVINPARAFG